MNHLELVDNVFTLDRKTVQKDGMEWVEYNARTHACTHTHGWGWSGWREHVHAHACTCTYVPAFLTELFGATFHFSIALLTKWSAITTVTHELGSVAKQPLHAHTRQHFLYIH